MIRGALKPFLCAAGVAVALAACGGSTHAPAGAGGGTRALASDSSATQILRAATAKLKSIRFMHIDALLTDATQRVRFNLDLKARSPNQPHVTLGQGTLSINGASARVIYLPTAIYMKPSAAFMAETGASAAHALQFEQLLGDRWLEGPAAGHSAGQPQLLGRLISVGRFLRIARSHPGRLTVIGAQSFQGQRVIGVHDATQHASLYVQVDGDHYPTELVHTGGAATGIVHLSRFNDAFALHAPKHTVTLAQLSQIGTLPA